jgi:predicted nucleic acid-binding protein
MSRFVTDCSVTMCWCFQDECDPYAAKILEKLDVNETLVPVVWSLEVANAMLIGERRGRLSEADILRFLEVLRSLPVFVDTTPSEQVFDDILALGRRHDLSSYDASYLELAMRQGIPLATLDVRLTKAAKAAGVTIFSP